MGGIVLRGNFHDVTPLWAKVTETHLEGVRSLTAVRLNIDRTHFGPTKVTHFRNCRLAMLSTLGPLEQIWPTVYKNVS